MLIYCFVMFQFSNFKSSQIRIGPTIYLYHTTFTIIHLSLFLSSRTILPCRIVYKRVNRPLHRCPWQPLEGHVYRDLVTTVTENSDSTFACQTCTNTKWITQWNHPRSEETEPLSEIRIPSKVHSSILRNCMNYEY